MSRKIMNKKSPDLLLVNPDGRKRIYQSLSSQLAAIEPPIWAGLMATYALNQDVSVEMPSATTGSPSVSAIMRIY